MPQTQPTQSSGIRIGLTGGLASGKSTVSRMFAEAGVPVIDADVIVHQLLAEDEELRVNIRSAFGEDVFTSQGQIDRKALGQVVFGHAEKRKLLESWIHPKVREAVQDFFTQHLQAHNHNHNHPMAVAEIPLLFESNLESMFDALVLVTADEATQINRFMAKGYSREETLKRLASQMPMADKIATIQRLGPPHTIIDNSGSLENTQDQIDQYTQYVKPGTEPISS